MCEGARGITSIYTEVQMVIYTKEQYLDWMFYTGTVGEVPFSQHKIIYFVSITALYSSASPGSLDIIFPVRYKENFILRVLLF